MLSQSGLENAVRVTLALGGSTNAVLHLTAIAAEAGVDITPDTFDALGRRTPLIARFAPASRLTVVDLHAAGGIPAVLNVLAPLLDTAAPTVDGRTLGEIAAGARVLRAQGGLRDDVLHPLDAPLSPQGGIAVLRGNLALMARCGKAPSRRPCTTTPASAHLRVGGGVRLAVGRHPPRRRASVIRNEGPAGGPACRWRSPLVGMGLGVSVSMIDGRCSGSAARPIGHVCPEAYLAAPHRRR
jgi:dihydroxy-acid dehydratase